MKRWFPAEGRVLDSFEERIMRYVIRLYSHQSKPARFTPSTFEPAYRALLCSGEPTTRIKQAYQHLEDCDLCARCCHVNRRQTLHGAICRTGEHAVVHSFDPHHGEENPIRGWNGSGTIFFAWGNLRCGFCQNYVPSLALSYNP